MERPDGYHTSSLLDFLDSFLHGGSHECPKIGNVYTGRMIPRSVGAAIGALYVVSGIGVARGLPNSGPDLDIVLNSNPHIGELDQAVASSIDQIIARRRAEDSTLVKGQGNLDKRDGRVNFCGQRYDEPDYSSWERGSTEYEPYFTPVFTAPNTSYAFELEEGVESPDAEYAAEHVYEIQLVADYFDFMAQNVTAVKKLLRGGKNPCTEIFRPVLLPTKQWADEVDYPDLAQPFDDFRLALSGGAENQDEFVFLEEDINGFKGRIFGGAYQDPSDSIENDPVANLGKVADAAMIFQYMNAAKPAASWKAVSDRMMAAARKLTRATSRPTSTLPAPLQAIDWTEGYIAFESALLSKIEQTLGRYRDVLLAEAETQIAAAAEEARERGDEEQVEYWTAYATSVEEAKAPRGRVAEEVYRFTEIGAGP